MKETLQLEQIDVQKIRKEYLIDKDGLVYSPNYDTDIDTLIENDNLYLVEVKATADNRDVFDLLKKAALYKKITGKTATKIILIALRMNQRNYDYAAQNKIKAIIGEIK